MRASCRYSKKIFNDDFSDLAALSIGTSVFEPGCVFKITLPLEKIAWHGRQPLDCAGRAERRQRSRRVNQGAIFSKRRRASLAAAVQNFSF